MQVSFFYRKSRQRYSIENVFSAVRATLNNCTQSEYKTQYYGTNPFKILPECMRARQHQGDVNHITGDVHYLALSLDKKRTVLTIHDCVSLERLKGWKRFVIELFWYRLPIKRATVVTVISEKTRNDILKLVPKAENKIYVVPDPISSDFEFHPKEMPTRPRILQIGTGKNKNFIRIAEALEGLDCELRIIGKLSDDQKSALDKNDISYTKDFDISNEQIIQEYQDSDLVVFASTYEGFGLPILEAQATGRPVITSNISPMQDVAGNGAVLIDPYDAQDIRRGIESVITDKDFRNKLVRKGQENAQKYSAKNIAAQYAELYRMILQNNQ